MRVATAFPVLAFAIVAAATPAIFAAQNTTGTITAQTPTTPPGTTTNGTTSGTTTGATTGTTPTPVPGTTPTPVAGATPSGATAGTLTVLQIVEVAQAVPPGGAPVTAFTPPAGTLLVVTDVLITNADREAACGVDLARASTAITGGLCVSPLSTLQLALTTGIEFTETAPVLLVNASTMATTPVRVHLRGFLTTATSPS